VVNEALPRLKDSAFNLEAVALQIAHHLRNQTKLPKQFKMASSNKNERSKWSLSVTQIVKETDNKGKVMARAVVNLVRREGKDMKNFTLPGPSDCAPTSIVQLAGSVRLLLYCFSTTNILGIFRQSHLIFLG
jgi:hypothetical protein